MATDGLQERIAALELRNGRRKYPPALRQEILEYAKGRMALGESSSVVAQALGVNDWTMSRWIQEERRAARGGWREPGSGFVEVPVSLAGSLRTHGVPAISERIEVECPNGFCVRISEGVDVAILRRVLDVVREVR